LTERINVLGVSIDVVEQNELLWELSRYLENDYLNVVFFATIKILEKASTDGEYRELLDCADYLLPGEKAIFSTCAPWLLKQPHLFTGLESIIELAELENKTISGIQTTNIEMTSAEPSGVEMPDAEIVNTGMADAEKNGIASLKFSINSIYCIGRTKEEIQWMIDYIAGRYPDIIVQGIFCEGMEEKEELLVNEINAAAPDLLIVTLDSPFQEEWVINNSTKLNAKLCIAIGTLCEELMAQRSRERTDIRTKFVQFCQKIIKMCRIQHFRKKADKYDKTSVYTHSR